MVKTGEEAVDEDDGSIIYYCALQGVSRACVCVCVCTRTADPSIHHHRDWRAQGRPDNNNDCPDANTVEKSWNWCCCCKSIVEQKQPL
jgi:hypothetical protein